MDELVTKLEQIQVRDGMTARAMAARLGIKEDYWCHLRRRSRAGKPAPLSIIRKAVVSFPELYPLVVNDLTRAAV